jgi:uncharacterized protein YndB with AHSA1/START domain
MEKAEQMAKGIEITITRIFDAPRGLVWKAWTVPEYLTGWWGPRGFSAPVIRIDFREGGRYLYCMRSPEGEDYWSTGTYREIVPYERIVATDSFADENGNIVPASHYGMSGDWPLELLTTLTFEELDGRTRITLRHTGLPSGEQAEMAEEGWNQSLDKLARLLEEGEMAMTTRFTAEPGTHEAVMTRIFDAPREDVFTATTDPKMIPLWWGPRSLTTIVVTMDVQRGGIWRYIQRDAGGNEYAFSGVYHEVAPPERLIFTFEFEGMPGHVMLETVIFEDLGDRTKVTDRTVFQTVEDRDGALATGMEEGAVESMDRLAELVEKKR